MIQLTAYGLQGPRLQNLGRDFRLNEAKDCFVAHAPRNDSTKHLRVIASEAKQSQRSGISPRIAETRVANLQSAAACDKFLQYHQNYNGRTIHSQGEIIDELSQDLYHNHLFDVFSKCRCRILQICG